jgi:hypothetical protein
MTPRHSARRRLSRQEDAAGYFELLGAIVLSKGIPRALYADRHGIFKRSTLAGVVAVAEQLPGSLGAEALDTARHAFAQSFEVTAVLTAAVVHITAALVTVVLRGDASEGESAADAQGVAVACVG